MLKSKEDLKKCYDLYDTCERLYHLYGVVCDTMLYVDNSHGELVPFFNYKAHREILYHNVHNGSVMEDGVFKVKELRSKVTTIDIKDDIIPTCGLVFTNCGERIIPTLIGSIQLNGMLMTTTPCSPDLVAGFKKLYESNGFYLYKRVEIVKTLKSSNAFSGCSPVQNKFTFEATNSEDVSLNIFKCSINVIRICGLRMDSNSACVVNVVIYSVDESESVKVVLNMDDPLLTDSTFVVPFDVDEIELKPIQQIPRVICQTLNGREVRSLHYKTALNIQLLNPEYEYRFHTSQERRRFIKKHFSPGVLDVYDGFVSGAFKADLFRYCWLYVNGGIYVDCKMIQRVPFRDIISSEDGMYLCADRIPDAYQNCLIGAHPLHPDLLKCVVECVKRFNKKIYNKVSFGSLYHTGPYLFYHCMQQHEPRAAFSGPFRDLSYKKTGIYCKEKGTLLFNMWFKGYYENYDKIHGKQIWSKDWAEGHVYFSNKFEVYNSGGKYSIRIHPSEMRSDLSLADIEFVYRDVGIVTNNKKDGLRCALVDEVNHFEQYIRCTREV